MANDIEKKEATRRAMIGALGGLGAALGLSALARSKPREQIEKDPAHLLANLQGASGTGDIAWADTMADLRALVGGPSGPQIAILKHFHAPSGGASPPPRGGGLFWWDPDGGVDDGGTVIVPASSGGTGGSAGAAPAAGAWRRIFSGARNVHWFGAVGDGVADDYDAFVAALASAGGPAEVLVPRGTYCIRTTLFVPAFWTLRGEGGSDAGNSTLYVGSASGDAVDGLRLGGYVRLSDLSIRPRNAPGAACVPSGLPAPCVPPDVQISPPAPGTDARGIVAYGFVQLSRCSVSGFPNDGFQFRGLAYGDSDIGGQPSLTDFSFVSDCVSEQNGGNGFSIGPGDATAILFQGCLAQFNGYTSIDGRYDAQQATEDPVSGALASGNGFFDDSGFGCTFVCCRSQYNLAGGGFVVPGVGASTHHTVIVGPYVEGNQRPCHIVDPAMVIGGSFNSAGTGEVVPSDCPTPPAEVFTLASNGLIIFGRLIKNAYMSAPDGLTTVPLQWSPALDRCKNVVAADSVALGTQYAPGGGTTADSEPSLSGFRMSQQYTAYEPGASTPNYPPGWRVWGWSTAPGVASFAVPGERAWFRGESMAAHGCFWAPAGLIVGDPGGYTSSANDYARRLYTYEAPVGSPTAKRGDRVWNTKPDPLATDAQRFAGWICVEDPSSSYPNGRWVGYGALDTTYVAV